MASERGCDLADLALADLQSFAPGVAADVYDVLRVDGSVAARDHVGGTAPVQVQAQVARWQRILAAR
jgi:argininosuccinate lyase